jgi:hypothetical protein
MYHLSNPSPD